MSHPARELQAALVALLKADTELTALLAPDGIRDGAARGGGFPHVTVAELASRDIAADGWAGREHRLTLTVWSRAGGRSELLRIMELISVISDGVPTALDTHRVVSFGRFEERVARGSDGRSWRGTIGFRAVTEPLN